MSGGDDGDRGGDGGRGGGGERIEPLERVVRVAEALGMNPVRVRWKLMRLAQAWERSRARAAETTAYARYEHAVCPECGRLNDRRDRTCVGCGRPTAGAAARKLGRLARALPEVASASSLLSLGILLVYGRMLTAGSGGAGGLDFDSQTLVRFGANYVPLTVAGEWWRLATAVFLHAGVIHLAFNLIALSQIGPAVEHLFGRSRLVFCFMVTGIVASAGSTWVGLGSARLSVGASGAVLGVIGMAAGWGHRDGTSIGRGVRDQMLKWCLYTVVIGAAIGADNAAHVAGFLAGVSVGLFAHPRPGGGGTFDMVAGVSGTLLAIASIGLALFPPG